MQLVETRKPLARARRLLELDYAPDVPLRVLHALERQGKALGLPLHQLELLGQDSGTAQGFIEACRQGDDEDYLMDVDWAMLEARLSGRPPIFN